MTLNVKQLKDVLAKALKQLETMPNEQSICATMNEWESQQLIDFDMIVNTKQYEGEAITSIEVTWCTSD